MCTLKSATWLVNRTVRYSNSIPYEALKHLGVHVDKETEHKNILEYRLLVILENSYFSNGYVQQNQEKLNDVKAVLFSDNAACTVKHNWYYVLVLIQPRGHSFQLSEKINTECI